MCAIFLFFFEYYYFRFSSSSISLYSRFVYFVFISFRHHDGYDERSSERSQHSEVAAGNGVAVDGDGNGDYIVGERFDAHCMLHICYEENGEHTAFAHGSVCVAHATWVLCSAILYNKCERVPGRCKALCLCARDSRRWGLKLLRLYLVYLLLFEGTGDVK